MKTRTTLLCILCTLFSFAQTPFLHIESQYLKKKNTEYFGTLIDQSASKKKENATLINFNPAIILNGDNDYFKVNQEIPDLKQMTVFSVFLPTENSKEVFDIWAIQTENSVYAMTNKIADNAASQLEYDGIKNGEIAIQCYTQYYNTGADAYTDGSTFISFGKNEAQNNSAFNGAIAELKLYNKVLTQTDKFKNISSLAIKYGVSLKNSFNYLASDNQIIWDAINDSIYSNQITGIGRDDALNLYQKQSSSTHNANFLTIGVDAIQLKNDENLGTIKNKYFMLWGSNNKALTINDETLTINRKWLINVTGNPEDDLTTQVKLNATQINTDTIRSYILIIDESANANFAEENLRFVYPTSISEEGIITYNNVQWDNDGSGKDVFSFRINEQNKTIVEETTTDNELINAATNFIKNFDVFPTISSDGNFKVEVQLEKSQDLSIQVLDMTGKLISNEKYKNQKAYFLDGVPITTNGIYNVVLTVGEEQITKKIVVEN